MCNNDINNDCSPFAGSYSCAFTALPRQNVYISCAATSPSHTMCSGVLYAKDKLMWNQNSGCGGFFLSCQWRCSSITLGNLIIHLSISNSASTTEKRGCLQSQTGLYWIILKYYHNVSVVGEEIWFSKDSMSPNNWSLYMSCTGAGSIQVLPLIV